MAFEAIEPFGEKRQDMRNAQLCSLLANINRGKNTRAWTIKDFLMFEDPVDKSVALSEQIKEAFRKIDAKQSSKTGK